MTILSRTQSIEHRAQRRKNSPTHSYGLAYTNVLNVQDLKSLTGLLKTDQWSCITLGNKQLITT